MILFQVESLLRCLLTTMKWSTPKQLMMGKKQKNIDIRHHAPDTHQAAVGIFISKHNLGCLLQLELLYTKWRKKYIIITDNSSSRNLLLNPTILSQPGFHWAWDLWQILLHESHEKNLNNWTREYSGRSGIHLKIKNSRIFLTKVIRKRLPLLLGAFIKTCKLSLQVLQAFGLVFIYHP